MSIRWTLKHGNILDEPADVLVCSANVFLNLSGGVGGELLLRCGPVAQEELHRYLSERGQRFVQQGDIVASSPHGLAFKAILHAVAVDGFYQTSPEIVRTVTEKSLRIAASLQANRVAMTALATGYGRLSMAGFAEAVHPLTRCDYPPINEIVICVRNRNDLDELAPGLEPLPR
ncbi:MAG TPA: macro domain-containing protein [Tepidisphaeraceae bacterium]